MALLISSGIKKPDAFKRYQQTSTVLTPPSGAALTLEIRLLGEFAMSHPALVPNAVAVITGGASGIGLAAAARFAQLGLKICIADLGKARLAEAATVVAAAAPVAHPML